jgi:SAM-dependent methyltransferase
MTEPVHPTAAAGFERAASVYDRARPGYPPAALELLRDALRLGPERRIVDLGAGTGKLTRALVATGADVVAVEPVPAMRTELRRLLPDVEVVDGRAEATGLGDASCDAATAAQAFHWFDPAATFAELRRVLVPDGAVAIVFNRRDTASPGHGAIEELLAPHRDATPSWADHRWLDALATDPPGFAADVLRTFDNPQQVDVEGAVERVASTSFVATMDDEPRGALLAAARERLAALAVDGIVTLDHVTEVRVLRRVA